MDEEKRKREDDGEVDGKRAKSKKDNNGWETVTDTEVEEFFAILRRIHVAVKYFEKSDGGSRETETKRWRPSFQLEDFEEDHDVKENGKREEGTSSLDLNLDPNSETMMEII